MNCDQVFDVLTRGPFPTGAASDISVQRHLSHCAECRQLAEALRPALDLIHESVPPEESWGLPGYWDDSTAPLEELEAKDSNAKAVDQRLAARQVRVQTPRLAVRRTRVIKERPKRKRARNRTLRNYLLATAAGIAAAAMVFAVQPPNRTGSTVAASTIPIAWPPLACLMKPDDAEGSVPVSGKELSHQLTNCTACHTAGQRHWLMQSPTLAVSQTCLECHQFVAHH